MEKSVGIKTFNDFLSLNLKRELDKALFLNLFTVTIDEQNNETPATFKFNEEVFIKLNGERVKTTIGRYLFNKFVLPDAVFESNYINSALNKANFKKISSILTTAKNSGFIDSEEVANTVDRLTWLASVVSSIQGGGLQANALFVSEETEEKIEKIRETLSIDMPEAKLKEADSEVVNILKKEFEGTDLHEIVSSGAKGSYENNMKSTFGYRGILEGRMIKGNLTDIKPEEYVTVNGLQGSYSRSNLTAVGGYGSKLVQGGLSHTFVDVKKKDCGTELTLKTVLKNPRDFLFRYVRLSSDKQAPFIMLTEQNIANFTSKTCDVRSVMFCKSKSGFCVTCFGESFKVNGIEKNLSALVTLLTADMMQKQMKSFHDLSIKYGSYDLRKIFKEG